jgi:hypothetical protein
MQKRAKRLTVESRKKPKEERRWLASCLSSLGFFLDSTSP